ncbi:GH25 family lysozyme [Fructobacillus cardui]|uniref:GH25 family lysozyme n=1 Tax=Fructobacillus cardui TaxID=2893170 RepID=UPI00200A3AE9|nr:GH25 family lysozyme [Fructobacillus cardui]MCK8626825.1 1,4-beta-N-acetylmuramidase [Fructobacillus cardui]
MNIKNGLLTLAAISTFGLVVDQNQIQVHADGVPRVTGGQAGLPRMDVVDVSSNNGYLSTNDFQIMKNNGVRGIIVKLTEGTYYRNPYASSQVNNARAVGLRVSAYHYSTFNNQNSARSEANFFADYATQLGFNSSDLMVNDLEDSSTTGGDVSGNSWAFNDQLKNRGFTNGALYTYTSYKNNNGLNTWFLANDHIWMAAYPYYPSINSLWNSQYGMWQWSSNAGFGGISGTFDVSIDYSGIASQLLNGYVYNGFQGHDGYRWYDNGQLGNGKRWYAGTYYWFSNGERIDNSWRSDATGTYYTGADGRSYQGLQTIGNAQYYFGSDFTLQKNQYVTVNGRQYYVNAQGIARPADTGYIYTGASGHDGYRWFDNGQIGSGKRWYAGTYYWFDQNGERIDNSWRSDATGTYYTGADGRSYQGLQTIGNAQYYFGSDFTLQKNQYVTVNGRQYYVNAQGIARPADTGYIYTGASGHDGYRWFDNGQIGSGKRWYAGTYYWFDQNGERIDNSWRSDATGTYYTGADGRSYQGLQTIGNAQYYFGSDFTLQKNQYVTVNGRQYYVNAQGIARPADTGYIYTGASGHDGYRWFDNGQIGSGKRWYAGTYYWFDQNGERIDNSWRSDATGTYYTGADGRSYQGLQTIGNAQYYFGSDFTLQKNQYVTVNGQQYYLDDQGEAKTV